MVFAVCRAQLRHRNGTLPRRRHALVLRLTASERQVLTHVLSLVRRSYPQDLVT